MHSLRLFLCGDVMTGRGVDQILPYPSDPRLYEPYVTDARDYLTLAEQRHGPILTPVDFEYIWGDALPVWDLLKPDLKLVNLETAVTRSNDAWPEKGIHYRMSPENVGCLASAGINFCALANNHVLDWGYSGLLETQETLRKAHIRFAGAGQDTSTAAAAALLNTGPARVFVISLGDTSSGIPHSWAATTQNPGVNLFEPGAQSIEQFRESVESIKKPGDILIVSIHWGPNWDFKIPQAHIRLARALVDEAGVDLIHGHSSHHALGIEVYRGHLVLYGCGDFINDYEGISGHEDYRAYLGLMYFADMDETGNLKALQILPMRRQRFRATRAPREDITWLANTLNREGKRFGTSVEWDWGSGMLWLSWA